MSDRIHIPDDFGPVLLSPDGRARRERILAEGMAAAAIRSQRRRIVRAASLSGVGLLAVAALWIVRGERMGMPNRDDGRVLVGHTRDQGQAAPPPPPAHDLAHAPAVSDTIERIDDARLLAMLAETGGSYGLVAIGNRVEVVRNDR